MIWNGLRRHPLLIDTGLVALVLALTVVVATHHDRPTAGVILGIAETLPLLWRRSRPIVVLGIVVAAGLAMIAVGVWFLPLQIGIALYTVAAVCNQRTSRLAGAATIGVTMAALAAADGANGDAIARLVFLGAAWLLGDGLGSRRAYVREIEEKADRLERERESETRRAAAEEQARIARELHDVVAHALSVIVIQAAAADDVFEVDPTRVREPIRAIETAARAALGDLRRVLGVLQDTGLHPQPGLSTLETLVEQVRATGLAVSLEIEGSPRPLPAAVDLSAYRIVQEALTNTLKHARAEHANIHVRYGDELGLEVRDDGVGDSSGDDRTGSGLIGMRERAAMLGGTVDTGRAPGGGYLVRARIPIGVA